MLLSTDELLEICKDDEIWRDEKRRINFLREIGLKPEPKIDDPEHYFSSEE